MDKKTRLVEHDLTKRFWPKIARHFIEDNIGDGPGDAMGE